MRDRILIRHFLRRLLDNDLISPHADRHQVLVVGVAALIASSLFVTVLLGQQYVFMPFQSPGRTAVLAVNDRVLYTAWSMVIMALVAVTQWDALTLDARDASILGPLPIPHRTVVRAKLAAVGLFAGAFAIALNGAPILLHPALMVAKLSVGMDVVLVLVASHLVSTMAAGAFGFLAVMSLRELLSAALGQRWFERVSPAVQAGLVLGLVVLFLLLPSLSADAAARWLASGRVPPLATPLLWFGGLQERLAGHVIDLLPHPRLSGHVPRWEAEALAQYRSQQPALRQLADASLRAFGLVALTALVAYAWNSRRLPAPAVARSARRRRGPGVALAWAACRFLVWRPLARAGFFFTLQVLTRSTAHRLALAASLAIGFAVATTILRGVDIGRTVEITSAPVGLLAIQTLLLMTLFAGIRHAIRVPAELRANWTFHLAFGGDERPYLAGVKRAALAGAAGPLLLLLFPLHAVVLGVEVALVHAAWGALVAFLLAEGTVLGFRKLPFASAYVPSGELKYLAPPLALSALGIAYGLAWTERVVLNDGEAIAFLGVFVMLAAALHAFDAWQRRARAVMDLDEVPASATQRFGLSE